MFKIQIGDKAICKLNNKEYKVTSTTTSSDETGKSSFRIKMQDENKNSIEQYLMKCSVLIIGAFG